MMTSGSASCSNATADVPFPRPYNAILAIVSSSLSVVGAVALIVTYFLWKDNRTISRFIVACIAASDFLTASGYIVMSSYLLWLQFRVDILEKEVSLQDVLYNDSFSTLRRLCEAQSFVTTTSSSWSFWWTAILAFHLYLILVHMQWKLAKQLVWVYVVVATAVPLTYTIPAMATGWLGVGCFSATTTWCFVGINPSHSPPDNLTCDSPGMIYKVLEAVEGKVWEVLAFITILVLYLLIWCTMVKIRAQVRWPDCTHSLCLTTPSHDLHCPSPSLHPHTTSTATPPHCTLTRPPLPLHLTAPSHDLHCPSPSLHPHTTSTATPPHCTLTRPALPLHLTTPSYDLHCHSTSLHPHTTSTATPPHCTLTRPPLPLHLTAPSHDLHCPSTSLHPHTASTAPPCHCTHTPLRGTQRSMLCSTKT